VKVDLVIKPSGDLQLTASGKLAVESNRAPAIKRRLTTPVGGYTRAVKEAAGWVDLDTNYFSKLPELVSLPATEVDLSILEEVVSESLAADPTIEVLSVNKTLGSSSVAVDLTYLDLLDNTVNMVAT
jgi:hypothetical protein